MLDDGPTTIFLDGLRPFEDVQHYLSFLKRLTLSISVRTTSQLVKYEYVSFRLERTAPKAKNSVVSNQPSKV